MKKFRIFIWFFLIVDHCDLETKDKEKRIEKKWLVIYEFVIFNLFSSYLPIHRKRSHEGKHRG